MKISQYLLHSFAPALFDREGVAYDLGANHGEFGAYLAPRFKTVVCVEPNPHLDLSGLPSNASLVRAAVGWPASRAWLQLSGVDVYSSLSSGHAAAGSKEGESVQVEVRTLAALFAEHGQGVIDFVKMDVEGAELDILLEESEEVLTRIKQLTVEFHDFIDPASTPRVLAAMNRMRRLGFLVMNFAVTNHGDVLFLNTRHVSPGLLARTWIALRYKWWRGLMRRLHRTLWPGADVPGGALLVE